MRKIMLIMLALFLNLGFYSCSPESVSDGNEAEQTTGDGDVEILPSELPKEVN